MSADPIKEARRILEDAGYGPDANPFFHDDYDHDCAAKAVWWLRRHDAEWERAAEKSRKQAEREAEDAKVREFRESSLSAFASVFNESNNDSTGWGGLSETGREGWRARYRAAREFFAREEIIPVEVVEPRLVESAEALCGKHWASKWEDADGCLWEFSPRGWGWRSNKDAYLRISDPEGFPWVEVLP